MDCRILHPHPSITKEAKIYMLLDAFGSAVAANAAHCNYETAERLVECLDTPDNYYTPASFAGTWLRNNLYFGIAKLTDKAGGNPTDIKFIQEANFTKQLEDAAYILASPLGQQSLSKLMQVYFLARQEQNERVIGRALRTALPGQRIDILLGKGYCT